MNYKPDEATLISFLYGELGEKEKQKLELYFQEHPEELKQLLELNQTRDLLTRVGEKEVIVPPVFAEEGNNVMPLWRTGFFRAAASIAACFLIMMVSARLIGTEVLYSNGELRISLGRTQEVKTQPVSTPGLSPDQVQGMINSALVKNNEQIASTWQEDQKKLKASFREGIDLNSRKMDDIVKNASLASQEQVRTFVDGLQSQNLRLMKDYLQLTSTEQKKYVENLLVDFSKYLQEQRNQDLNFFQTRMSSMEKNTDQFKQETEQILSSIISTGGVNKNKNSY